jgi:hypothetical protein
MEQIAPAERSAPMADEKPENTNGKGGPGSPPGGSRPGANDEGQGRRSGRHRGFRGRHGGNRDGAREASPEGAPGREGQGQRPRDQRVPRPEEAARQDAARDMPACPLCGKPVYDLSTALAASREASDPAHFDCVLERVAASETLAAGEALVYLGSGAFGVVEFKDKNESLFTIKRRIQWEKEGEKKDWRKGLSSRIANL